MTEFSYAQALLFFKEDIDQIKKKTNSKLVFEQDGASSHTSKSNIFFKTNYLLKMDGCNILLKKEFKNLYINNI